MPGGGNKRKDLLTIPELRNMLLDEFNLSGILILSPDRTIVYSSHKAMQTLEMSENELVGESFARAVPLLDNHAELIPDEKRPSVKALRGGSVQAIFFFCQYRLPKSGELVSLAVRAAPIMRKNKVLGAIIELRRAVRQVDVDEMKSLFTAFAAHQLKTPSSIVKGFLELMMRQGKQAYKSDQWHFLISAFDANERLIRLSQTLLNIAKLEGGMIEPRVIMSNIVRVLEDKVKSYQRYNTDSMVQLKLVADKKLTHVFTDPTFVSEIVDVCIHNAIKIAPHGSKVSIKGQIRNQNIEISIQDEGPGLPEEILTQFRGPIADQHPQTSQTGGTGLGLYMARKYAALLHGDIVAENVLGGGAKLTLVVPADERYN